MILRSERSAIALLLFGALPLAAAADDERFGVEDLVRLSSVSAPDFSPDGEHLIYSVESPDREAYERVGSQQMYQALRSLRVPTQLVIYPGEWHPVTVPSYLRDRMRRHLDWYGLYFGVVSRP